ncbi:MAG: hypothetical protein ACQEWV_02635 [Bacillota bacterium]
MTTILLLISLLLHVVAFYFIVVLYMKYSNVKDLSDSQRKMLEETEYSMTSFLIEMKDENERLIQNLKKSPASFPQPAPYPQTVKDPETREEEIVMPKSKPSDIAINDYANSTILDDLPDYLTGINKVEDIIEINHSTQEKYLPFEIEAINLYKNGHTVEQIAKKLIRGKTEIELLLKFRQK